MLQSLSSRLVFSGLVLISIAAMAFAMVLEHRLGLPPCPLCMTQRVFVVGFGVIAFIAFLHNPSGAGNRVYGALCTLFAITGGAVAARHVWLQHLPEDQVPACGPPLDYLLENFPLQDAINTMLMGDGNCAEKSPSGPRGTGSSG